MTTPEIKRASIDMASDNAEGLSEGALMLALPTLVGRCGDDQGERALRAAFRTGLDWAGVTLLRIWVCDTFERATDFERVLRELVNRRMRGSLFLSPWLHARPLDVARAAWAAHWLETTRDALSEGWDVS